MTTTWHDVRYAFRLLRKAPTATFVAVLSLAVGISINTTVFSWIRAVILNPVPGVVDGRRLVTVETVAPSGTLIDSSYPDFQAIRDRATSVSGVIAFKERPLGLGARDPERVWALMVSGNYFDVLGVKPAVGRFFEGEEQRDVWDAHAVAVLSHGAWTSRFNADPAVVGRTVLLNQRPFTIAGVAPDGFFGTINGLHFDLYVPLAMQSSLTGGGQWLVSRGSRPLYLFARLKPGVTVEQARSELSALGAGLAAEFPQTNQHISFTALPMNQARRGAQQELGPLLRILAAVAALVLVIVCGNVANLQLARATARDREIAIRLGLGASRARMLRQLLTEGLVLGVLGGLAGLVASAWLVDTLRWLMPFVEYPLNLHAGVAGRELVFAAGLSVVVSVLFGLLPALRASGTRMLERLRAAGRRDDHDPRVGRIGALLVVGEVALAMAALVTAGLLVRSFENARRADPGFQADGVLLAGINLSTGGYDRDRAIAYLDRARDAVGQVAGVTAVSLAEDVPLGFNGGSWEELRIEGYTPAANENVRVYRNLIAPGYFDVMRIPLRAGRDASDADTPATKPVAIVNETFERRYFGGRSAVGRRFRGWGRAIEIVGVVADSRYHGLSEAAEPYFYVPLRQFFLASTGVALHVRTDGGRTAIAARVRRALQALDPALPAPVVVPLRDYTAAASYPQRLAAMLLSVLGALALMLASLGLYSLQSYAVARRRQEIGVRMALGATSRDVLRLIVTNGLTLVGLGVAVGSALAAGGTRALAALLFGVSPLDAGALAGAALLLIVVALVATLVPARAASRVDPMTALRLD